MSGIVSFKKYFTFENIDDITILDYGYFRDDVYYTIKTLQNLCLLRSYCKCVCGGFLNMSTRNGSVFEFSKLPLWKFFFFCIVQHPTITYETIRVHLDIASVATIFEWKSFDRDLMT